MESVSVDTAVPGEKSKRSDHVVLATNGADRDPGCHLLWCTAMDHLRHQLGSWKQFRVSSLGIIAACGVEGSGASR